MKQMHYVKVKKTFPSFFSHDTRCFLLLGELPDADAFQGALSQGYRKQNGTIVFMEMLHREHYSLYYHGY